MAVSETDIVQSLQEAPAGNDMPAGPDDNDDVNKVDNSSEF